MVERIEGQIEKRARQQERFRKDRKRRELERNKAWYSPSSHYACVVSGQHSIECMFQTFCSIQNVGPFQIGNANFQSRLNLSYSFLHRPLASLLELVLLCRMRFPKNGMGLICEESFR